MRRMLFIGTVIALVLLVAAPVGATKATHQSADTYTFGLEDVGESSAVRTDTGISVSVSADGLDPGVYTMWWVVWNNPEECLDAWACLEHDFGDPDIQVAVGYAGGVVVGSNGKAHVSAHLSEGETLAGFPDEYGITPASSLADSRHAEVHVVLRDHGDPIAGLVGNMLQHLQRWMQLCPRRTGWSAGCIRCRGHLRLRGHPLFDLPI